MVELDFLKVIKNDSPCFAVTYMGSSKKRKQTETGNKISGLTWAAKIWPVIDTADTTHFGNNTIVEHLEHVELI
jgi:hypothetical protein